MRCVVLDPGALGPSYSAGDLLEVSADRFARWVKSGVVRPLAVAPPEPIPDKLGASILAALERAEPEPERTEAIIESAVQSLNKSLPPLGPARPKPSGHKGKKSKK